jgi:hypothetical protein
VTDSAPIPDRVVGNDSSVLSLAVPALTEATDYWNGAIGVFIGTGTATAALRGMTFHVRKWDLASKKLALAQPLPIVPASGDTFKLIASGKAASNYEVLAMKVSGKQPEVESVSGTQVTGVTIKKVSALLGEGMLTLNYSTSPSKLLTIKMGTGNPGPETTFTANATNAPVYNADLSGYILVDVNFAALPTSSRSDTFTLTAPKGNLIPNMEGFETNDGVGRSRYHLIVAKNRATSALDAMTAFSIWTGKPVGTQTTITGSYYYSADTPGSINVSNASNWPTRGFWVRNRTTNGGIGDLRYVDYRSGNTLYVKPVTWGYLPFKTGTVELKPGMASDYGHVLRRLGDHRSGRFDERNVGGRHRDRHPHSQKIRQFVQQQRSDQSRRHTIRFGFGFIDTRFSRIHGLQLLVQQREDRTDRRHRYRHQPPGVQPVQKSVHRKHRPRRRDLRTLHRAGRSVDSRIAPRRWQRRHLDARDDFGRNSGTTRDRWQFVHILVLIEVK